MSSDNLNTLHYWFDVEALMFQDVPKESKPRRRAFYKRYTDLMLWQLPEFSARKNELKYFVYFGLVDKNALERQLLTLYAVAEEDEDYAGNRKRNTKGQTYLCSIEVNDCGRPSAASLQVAAWAIAFAERKNRTSLDYDAIVETLKKEAETQLAQSPLDPVDGKWFDALIATLLKALDWLAQALMTAPEIAIHTIPLLNEKGKPIKKPPELEPINSFYVDDLGRILKKMSKGAGAQQVSTYLAASGNTKIDVTQIGTINSLLATDRFPPGRWPSRFPLFLMQQLGVNTALHELSPGGVFSVNGPPGTGKTTLLMDIIAARIVERAEILAGFDDPQSAFSVHDDKVAYPPNNQGIAAKGKCYILDPRLLDFGIVVASANNNAVENITRDLPNLAKVDPALMRLNGSDFDYFKASAEAIINDAAFSINSPNSANSTEQGLNDENSLNGAEKPADPVKCWGLISVALGNKANRTRAAPINPLFRSAFGRPGESAWCACHAI